MKRIAVAAVLFTMTVQELELTGLYRFSNRDGLIYSVVGLLNSLAYSAWLRNQPEANELQRRVGRALIGQSVLTGLGWWVAFSHGADFHAALIIFYLINATGWWTAGVVIEPRGVVVATGFALSAVLGMMFPTYALACGVCIGLSFWVLSRRLRSSPVAPLQ